MSGKLKAVLTIVIIAAVLFAAGMVYSKYSAKYESDIISQATKSNTVKSSDSSFAATDFTVYDKNSSAVSLSDFKGKPIVVNFWASWCGYCKEEMPYFQAAYATYGNDIQFVMVAMTGNGNDSHANADAVIANSGYTFPVFYDDKASASSAYSVRSFPTTLFIDRNGNIVQKQSGAMNSTTLNKYLDMIK